MKKTYTPPVVIVNGDVTRQTMGSGPDLVEDATHEKIMDFGSGFYL